MNMPDEIWIDTVRGEDGFLVVGGADIPKSEAHRDFGHFIRLDLHKAAVAAARAEGMREAARIAAAERDIHDGNTLMDMSARITCDEIAAAIRAAAGVSK